MNTPLECALALAEMPIDAPKNNVRQAYDDIEQYCLKQDGFYETYDEAAARILAAEYRATYKALNELSTLLDLMRDEFLRIIANQAATEEIKWKCRRAISDITSNVSIITQRDNAEKEARIWETRYNEQTEVAALLARQRDEAVEKLNATTI